MRVLYLHGFASGPRSTKGLAFEHHFAARGVAIERLDLRIPSLEHLRLSAMLEVVGGALARGPAPAVDQSDEAVLIGSSLGALCAARVAEREPRVRALVLLAPAFKLAQRWREQLGAEWEAWRVSGWRAITDYTTGQPARVDFGFVEDIEAVDRRTALFPDVRVPTLILHVTRDDVVPIEYSRAFTRLHPHVQLIELDDTHELVASLPRLLAESEAFLARIAS